MALGEISCDDAEKILNQKVADQYNQCCKAFRDYDLDKSLTIDKSEFKKMLGRYNLFLNEYEMHKMLQRVSSHSGTTNTINYHEFVKYFAKEMHGEGTGTGGTNDIGLENPKDKARIRPNPTIGVDAAEQVMKMKITSHYRECSKAFRNFDKDHSGSIEFSEFKLLLARLNVFMKTERDMRTLFDRIDKNKNGVISFPEFVCFFGLEINPPERDGIGLNSYK